MSDTFCTRESLNFLDFTRKNGKKGDKIDVLRSKIPIYIKKFIKKRIKSLEKQIINKKYSKILMLLIFYFKFKNTQKFKGI